MLMRRYDIVYMYVFNGTTSVVSERKNVYIYMYAEFVTVIVNKSFV